MAKRARKKRKATAWNRKFGKASIACFRKRPGSPKELGRCIKAELKR